MNLRLDRPALRGAAGVSSLSLASLLAAPLLFAACGSSSSSNPDGNLGGGWPKGNIVLADTNNYTSQTTLTIPTVTTASGADLMVCWDGIKKDLLCHDVTTGNAVDNVSFLQIPNLTHDQVSKQLAVGQLDTNLVKVYRDYYTSKAPAGTTCANLSLFQLGTMLNPATDYVAPPANQTVTYMLLFETGTTPGVGSKSMMFLDPSASSTVMSVAGPDACASNILDFNATLGQPMAIPAADNTKWHIDWSQITKDSFGTAVTSSTFSKIDSVLLGFYKGKTAADLQADFINIDRTASTMYKADVAPGARDVDLVNAKDVASSAAFPGFTETDGVWAIAVQCGKCQIPAPVVMTILDPQ